MSGEGSLMRNLPRLLRRIKVPYAVLLLSSVICSTRAFPLQNDFRRSLRTLQNLAYLTLGFEQNLGQASPTFGFLARANGYFLYLGNGEFVIEFTDPGDPSLRESVRVTLVGADHSVEPEGTDPLPGVTHYYFGSDPRAWITNVKRS